MSSGQAGGRTEIAHLIAVGIDPTDLSALAELLATTLEPAQLGALQQPVTL
ncbi:MAG: hypothetical protein ABSH29_18790 [Acidimicrobiales bacterium]|jgi:hypothetical protein